VIFRVYRLQRPVPNLAIVADSYHVRPLIRIVQSADRYQILALDRQKVELFEGNRDALAPVDLPPEVPRTFAEAVGEEPRKPQVTVWTPGSQATKAGIYHGADSWTDAMKN